MPQFNKHFTVEEANQLLPHILSVFEKIHSIREQLGERKENLEKVHKAAPGNGGGKEGAELVSLSESVARLVAGLEEQGILVKDIDAGLVDFPYLREDREVFLCWKMGEKEVAFWHDLETGYRGRQPL